MPRKDDVKKMPRGRKVDSDGEVTRKILFNCAIEQFANHGYHSTKISDIVKKANVTQPTFYIYFENKETIFEEIIKSFQQQLMELTADSLLEENIEEHSLKSEIVSGLTRVLTFFAENPLLTKIGFFEADSASKLKHIMVKKIAQDLEAEQKLGYFSDELDMYIVATSLVGSIERLTLCELFTSRSKPDDLAKILVDIYFSGIQK